jgi:Superinfection immunity protein
LLVAIAVGLLVYFTPSIVAIIRRNRPGAVFLINLLFGWTIAGWFVACWMAITELFRHQNVTVFGKSSNGNISLKCAQANQPFIR